MLAESLILGLVSGFLGLFLALLGRRIFPYYAPNNTMALIQINPAVVRLMTSMVCAIRPNDPVTFLMVALLVGAISILAAYIPARRAARIEPLVALREE